MEKAELIIRFDPTTGQIQVTGPIQNEMLSFWMLDKAKDSIKEFNKNAGAQRGNIIPVNGGALPNLRRR
jgi:hypothetical protein